MHETRQCGFETLRKSPILEEGRMDEILDRGCAQLLDQSQVAAQRMDESSGVDGFRIIEGEWHWIPRHIRKWRRAALGGTRGGEFDAVVRHGQMGAAGLDCKSAWESSGGRRVIRDLVFSAQPAPD